MFTRKPRLQLEKFAINGAKRLLQHNRHKAKPSQRTPGKRILLNVQINDSLRFSDCGVRVLRIKGAGNFGES
jgi:hypothetical protein